jgi:hypothetical protein
MKKLVIMSLVVLVAVFLAAPSAMAKKQLTEDELEMITAAGQPFIIDGGAGSIQYTDTSAFDMILPAGAQAALMALAVNNVVGENQIANAFNIMSTVATLGGAQTNDITQSWGSTKDTSFGSTTVAGVAADGGAGGDGGDAEQANVCLFGAKCGIQYGKAGDAGAGGAGGAGSTKSGVIAAAVLSSYADVIISGTGDIIADVNPVFAMQLDETSQAGLLALVVNNVVGMNQVANALNIAAASVQYNPAGLGFIAASTQGASVTQSNTINQFRGTPFARPLNPVTIGVAP